MKIMATTTSPEGAFQDSQGRSPWNQGHRRMVALKGRSIAYGLMMRPFRAPIPDRVTRPRAPLRSALGFLAWFN